MLRSSLSRNAGGHGGNAGEETYDMGVHIFVPKHLVPWTSLDPPLDLIRSSSRTSLDPLTSAASPQGPGEPVSER